MPHSEHLQNQESKWHTLDPDTVAEFTNVVNTTMEAGDALLFHSLMPHSAQVNLSDEVRFVVNLRYRDLANRQYLEDNWQVGNITHARNALGRKDKG
ncbi:MAG: ectoine hydroxylase-related dioxygenase (phytanoyl-CoA dioxygenase family) [Gammaproteobacteria bacterium]|jgi:ectoine hydroxylase-related dioxygenase (phytanoyl-CoA dioxygenase family)